MDLENRQMSFVSVMLFIYLFEISFFLIHVLTESLVF